MVEELNASGMLAKGLTLLIALGDYPDGVGLSELARRVGMPVSTSQADDASYSLAYQLVAPVR